MNDFDDFIFLGSNKFSGTDKQTGNAYTSYKIAFAVEAPDSFFSGYECNIAGVPEDWFYKLSKLKPLDHFKGIVVRHPKRGLIIYRLA